MDFHSLTRRDLQALCKKNKIPANMTNVAMADSLKALEIVEGIEEFLQKCESETAQSSIESPVRSEVTSPYVPPTGGRSTRRGNVAKEEPETAKPLTRTQRSTRRTVAKYADEPQTEAIETPALAPQTNRKKGQIASARRNMDSQLKECVEEEKNDALVTPAPSGVASRRRRVAKEESAVKQVFSTRRSVRLAKKNGELLNEVGKENPDVSKKDLFTDVCQELKKMNLKESSDDKDEVSGINGVVDADNTTLEENSEGKDEAEVVSAEKLEIYTVNEVEVVPTIEDGISNHTEADDAKTELKESSDVEENSETKDEAEVVSAEKQDISSASEVELVPPIEDEMSNHSEADGAKLELKESCDVEIEEAGSGSEVEAELEEEKFDKTEAQENDGSYNFHTSEVEVEIEKIEQQNTDKDAGYEDQAANCGENAVLEIEEQNAGKDAGYEDEAANCGENTVLEDNFAVCEVSCDTDIYSEIEKEIYNDEEDLDSEYAIDFNADEEVLEINADVHGDSEEKELNPDEPHSVIFEAAEESIDITYQSTDDSLDDNTAFDISFSDEEDEASKLDAVIANLIGKHDAIEENDESNLTKDTELELQQSAEEVLPGKELNDVAVEEAGEIEIVETEENKNDPVDAPFCGGEEVKEQLFSIKNSPRKQLEVTEGEKISADFPNYIPTSLTPIKASATKASSAKKKRIMTAAVVSDNKENIGSGSKLVVVAKEKVKIAKNTAEDVSGLNDMSMRKLTKMLREKLQISNKSSKNENDSEVTARPALQALPENRWVD